MQGHSCHEHACIPARCQHAHKNCCYMFAEMSCQLLLACISLCGDFRCCICCCCQSAAVAATLLLLLLHLLLQMGTSCRAQPLPIFGVQWHVHWLYPWPCPLPSHDRRSGLAQCVLCVWQLGCAVVYCVEQQSSEHTIRRPTHQQSRKGASNVFGRR